MRRPIKVLSEKSSLNCLTKLRYCGWVSIALSRTARSNKARVRWFDGEYEGLEECVPKIRLLAPREEAEALLEDERRMLAAVATCADDGSDQAE